MNRVDEIINEKIKEAECLIVTTEAIELSDEERLKEFKAGNFTVRKNRVRWGDETSEPLKGIHSSYNLNGLVKFHKERPASVNKTKYDAFCAKINKKRTETKDAIMLSDSEKALKMLDDLVKIKIK